MRTILFLTLVFLACCKKHIEAPVVSENPCICKPSINYSSGHTYTIKSYAVGLSGKDKGYVITDNFGVGDIGPETPADFIEVTICESGQIQFPDFLNTDSLKKVSK